VKGNEENMRNEFDNAWRFYIIYSVHYYEVKNSFETNKCTIL